MEFGDKPKISVVIPFRNAEKFLHESLESVIKQECNFPFEVIAINDNSTDKSFDIAKTFSSPNVLIYNSTGTGISDALNLGVKLSNGALIARHDADDVMVQGRLQSQFDFMQNNLNYVVLGGQISFIGTVSENQMPNHYPYTSRELESWLARGCYLAHPTVIFRKDKFLKIGGYRKANDGAEDYDLWLRFAKEGKIGNLESVVTRYRIHENQVTNKKWVRTHLRTSKVRLIYIFRISKLSARSPINLNGMKISRIQMLKYLLIETGNYSKVQIRNILKK